MVHLITECLVKMNFNTTVECLIGLQNLIATLFFHDVSKHKLRFLGLMFLLKIF